MEMFRDGCHGDEQQYAGAVFLSIEARKAEPSLLFTVLLDLLIAWAVPICAVHTFSGRPKRPFIYPPSINS